MSELMSRGETADWLAGGGEMGALIRAFDWSATPVGAIASWSPSLRTTVNLLLASRHPMTLIWGVELIQFYNDGYMQLLGSKHPSALGRPHRETFPEVLETVSPMIQSVITTGIPIWEPEQLLVLEREGYPEECYFTLSYSPVQDDTGRIAGMLCVCSETTQKVLGERRLRLLRDLAARTGEARTLEVACRDITTAIAQQPLDIPFALIYLREPDGRSLALYGTVGLAQGTADPVRVSLEEPDADLWSLTQAASGETILIEGLEARQLPGGSWSDPAHSALVLPIPSSNQEPPMGVLVAGISPRRALDEGYRSFFELLAGQVAVAIANAQAYEQERKRTEKTISALNRDLQNRVNELQTLFDVVPIGILITNDLEFRNIKANPAFAKILGISPEANASRTPANSRSRPSYKVLHNGKEITPDDTPLRYAAIHGVTLEGAEVDIVRGDGAVFNLYGYAAPLLDEDGNSRGAVGAFLDISDRKRTEAALRLSQERYRSLAESLPQLLCMADADGITQYCNQSWINYTGLTLEQTQGTGWQQAIHPDDLPLVVKRWIQVRETSNNYSIELRVRRVDGVYRWHLSRIVPIKAEEDKIVGWLGTAADIDDRKRTEQQERFLAQASQTFAAASLDLQTILDTITQLTSEFTNDVCVLSLLTEDGEWLDPLSCYHVDPEVREFVSKLLKEYPRRANEGIGGRVIQTGEPLLMPVTSEEELRAAIKPEYQRYLERFRVYSTLIVPLKVRGQAIGVLSLTRNYPGKPHNTDDQSLFQDLADRAAMAIANARLYQQAQQARQQAEQTADRTARLQAVTAALSESLTPTQVAEVIVEQSIAVLDAASAMVVIVSESGTELEIVHHVGYQQNITQEWRRFPITTAVPLAEAVRTGEPIWEESTQERIARYPHLAQNYAELNYAAWISLPLMVEGRAVGGISLNFVEFSPLSEDERAFMLALAQQCAQAIARSQLYEAEQRARADAEAANRIKDEFLAVLSHELRSPLNPILGWTRLLRTRKFDEQATNRALETIERNATLQTKLIEDLLDVSRILRGKMVLNVSPVNLATTIESALETVQLAAEAKGIEIKTSLAPNVGLVLGDAARLQQVVWNLLSNAVKFTPSGGRVEVHVEQDAWCTQICVSDTGKGINPEFLPYVFERFRQEDGRTTRNFGGLGLGLAIVRHLVELHGGTVQAESRGEGQGATFRVKLPLTRIGKEPDFESESQVTTVNLNQLRILVVDDEVDVQELLVAILSEYGAQVSVAASAAAALTLLDQFKPDVLISDIGMPVVDGYMLMRQVRQLPPQQGGLIQAIALTAYAGELNQQQALDAGFQRHVTKPIEPDELVKTIAVLVGRSL
ncbi:MAG: GAF domain-containing protein [Microcoleus sp. SIO2G3]|nr:GAF domain-containing protein [Microcoleus sp. SIO2G3]